jgi:hypothetical protein
MKTMYSTPETYKQSREIFLNSLSEIRSFWPDAQHSSFVVSKEEDLTIDCISADAIETREQLIFLSTGLHGIEGYLGSVMLQVFINDFLPLLDPVKTGLMLVHCINPTGMNNRYRTNQANVDLNRNFIFNFPSFQEINIDYPKLYGFFNPKTPIRSEIITKFVFIFKSIKWFILFGPYRIREAALMGQYYDPSGMYFGGLELQPETQYMMDLISKWIPNYLRTLHLEMHSGYGPRNQMTLVQSSKEPMTSLEAKRLFNIPYISAATPDEFYQMHGEMVGYMYDIANQSNRKLYSAAFEFGTYGDSLVDGARSLLTTIIGNQLVILGSSAANRVWVEHDYEELYFPSKENWIEIAVTIGKQAFRNILKAEKFIN